MERDTLIINGKKVLGSIGLDAVLGEIDAVIDDGNKMALIMKNESLIFLFHHRIRYEVRGIQSTIS